MSPKLTIITVNYNNAGGLEKTIESVINQTFTDFEFLIIDGGSTDESVSLIKRYVDKITFWVSEPDRGVYHAMNKGILKSRGEYCYFLNSGDYLFRNETLHDIFSISFSEDIVCGNIVFNSSIRKRVGGHPSKVTLSFLFHSYLCHQAILFKRELFTRIGLYDENFRILADWAFYTLALAKYKASYLYIDVNFAFYDTTGISSRKDAEFVMQQEKMRIINENFHLLIDDMAELDALRKELKSIKSSPLIYNTLIKLKNIKNKYLK